MKRQLIVILLAILCFAGCKASDNSYVAEDCAAPEAAGAREFRLIQDFDTEVYGLAPETKAAAQGSPVCADADGAETTISAYAEPTSASAETGEAFAGSVPLIYTIFEPSFYIFSAEDGTKLFMNQSFSPMFGADVPSAEKWLNDIACLIGEDSLEIRLDIEQQAQIAYTDQQGNAGDSAQEFYTYSYYANASTGRVDEVVISLLQTDNIYCGGAHPNYVQKAFNFDLNAQRLLTLSDILYPEGGQVLLDQILTQLDQKLSTFESIGFFSDYQEIVTDLFTEEALTPYWYFSEQGLVVYFNCYEIAPYAAGIIKVELPYHVLEGVLLPEYFPVPRVDDEDACMALLESGEDRRVISVPALEDGTSFLFGSVGTVYDVRLFHLDSWAAENTPIAGQMLFAANRLTSSDALELTEPDNNPMPLYMLTYRNGAGEQYRFTVSREAICQIHGS